MTSTPPPADPLTAYTNRLAEIERELAAAGLIFGRLTYGLIAAGLLCTVFEWPASNTPRSPFGLRGWHCHSQLP